MSEIRSGKDSQAEPPHPAGDRAAMARYPAIARLWAREALRKGDAEGVDRAAETAMEGCKSRPTHRLLSRQANGFEKEGEEASDFLAELCGKPGGRSLGELSRRFGGPDRAAERILGWAASPRASADFAAAALGRVLEAQAEPSAWAALGPPARAAAERVRLSEPVWAKELARRASLAGAHSVAEELGGPSKEVGERLSALAKALLAMSQRDELSGARAREELAELIQQAPETLKDKAPMRLSEAGEDARDPLNWGCDDQTMAQALRLARSGEFNLTLSRRGQPDFLALGIILIHGSKPEAFGELLGMMKERGIPLFGRLGSRHHLAEHEGRFKIDAGRSRSMKPVVFKARSLFEAAMLKGADWAKEALIEAGHPEPKMASVEKSLTRWAEEKGGAGRAGETALGAIGAMRSEQEAWALSRSAAPAAKPERPRSMRV